MGVARINAYVTDPSVIATEPFLHASAARGWVQVKHWPQALPKAPDLDWWSPGRNDFIRVGAGDVFYYSQGLALLDCIYDAAARGVKYVISLDMDELVVANVTKVLNSNRHVTLPWRNYAEVPKTPWLSWTQSNSRRKDLGKTFMVAPDVLDADVHAVHKCVTRKKCGHTFPREFHVAHLQPLPGSPTAWKTTSTGRL